MRADCVGGTYCAAPAAPGMDNAVPAGAYQYALAGRLLATRREGFLVCARGRIPRGSGASFGCAGDLHHGKNSGGGACGVSTSRIFSDPHAGMSAGRWCRTEGGRRGAADKAPPGGGYKDSQVAETEASGADIAGTGADY